jgi:predicted TIM-barrel fold metal-dependent hydrolase
MAKMGIVDTHAHIIDPIRFPFADGPGYKPTPEEAGTSEDFCAVLDTHHVAHALLVQPSGYGYDNSAMLDA